MIARRFYLGPDAFAVPRRLAGRMSLVHALLLNKYWVDEIYHAVVVQPIDELLGECREVLVEIGWVRKGAGGDQRALGRDMGGQRLRPDAVTWLTAAPLRYARTFSVACSMSRRRAS